MDLKQVRFVRVRSAAKLHKRKPVNTEVSARNKRVLVIRYYHKPLGNRAIFF